MTSFFSRLICCASEDSRKSVESFIEGNMERPNPFLAEYRRSLSIFNVVECKMRRCLSSNSSFDALMN